MPTKLTIDSKSVTKPKSAEEIRNFFACMETGADPETVLQEAYKEIRKKKENRQKPTLESNLFQALTLVEFEKGWLMTFFTIPEQYKTFGVDMMRQLQKEYNCTTISEKATAELATISYIRTLGVQSRINSYLGKGELTEIGVKFLAVMSKELDRANRHYLTAIQALRLLKQPPMQINVSADTAIIGQNQVVQANHD